MVAQIVKSAYNSAFESLKFNKKARYGNLCRSGAEVFMFNKLRLIKGGLYF
jgi:hypothetical protein